MSKTEDCSTQCSQQHQWALIKTRFEYDQDRFFFISKTLYRQQLQNNVGFSAGLSSIKFQMILLQTGRTATVRLYKPNHKNLMMKTSTFVSSNIKIHRVLQLWLTAQWCNGVRVENSQFYNGIYLLNMTKIHEALQHWDMAGQMTSKKHIVSVVLQDTFVFMHFKRMSTLQYFLALIIMVKMARL